jgi:hypothetical protein
MMAECCFSKKSKPEIVAENENLWAIIENNKIKIYSQDGETYKGSCPIGSSNVVIEAISDAYDLGINNGESIGEMRAKNKIRQVLGIEN